MKMKKRLLGILLSLVLVLSLLPGMSLTAYADNTETKLTTIKPTSVSTYNQNPDGFVTVTLEGNMDYSTDWQAWIAKAFKSASVTVVGKEDYAITKCIFHNAESTTKTVTEKPFMVDLTFLSGDINRVGSIEVYGTVKPANPATVVGTATVDNDGNTVDLSNYVSLNGATGAVTYEISGDAKGCTLQGSVLTSGSSAGTVTVNVSVAADDNYRSLAAKPITVTINKTNAVPATVAANNRTYDGTEKPLVTVTGTPTGGTMQYVLGTDATTAPADNLYTTSIPTGTEAGTYYVWYKVVGDSNHIDSKPACVTATITKKTDPTPDPEKSNPTDKEKAAQELTAAKKEAQSAMNQGIVVTQKGEKIQVKWKRVKKASGYYVYAGYCSAGKARKVKTIKNNKTTKATISKINGKKIKLTKQFKVYVVAYKKVGKKNVTLAKTMQAHVVGSINKTYTNVKNLKLAKTKMTVKKGKTAKIKAKIVLQEKGKKHIPKTYAPKLRYRTSDKSIATVSKSGKLKGVKKGKCTVYVTAINGLTKKVTVTVK